jgi:branched-chain amino acid transport system substrate-binding protein
MGMRTDSQYCDGIQSPENQKFAEEYRTQFGTYPSYYSDAGYAKARLLVEALTKLNGDTSDKKAVVRAMRTTQIQAARGPVKLAGAPAYAPIQNVYICQVQTVNGVLRNVPIKTYPNVQPWGPLSQKAWIDEYRHDSAGQPSP